MRTYTRQLNVSQHAGSRQSLVEFFIRSTGQQFKALRPLLEKKKNSKAASHGSGLHIGTSAVQ